ncbi:unnamed protein product [Linum tenue]|uniref:Zinc transporter 5 n=2 Tax=Linum tenue TaxID=586396 RepID=A0AAV0MXW2_9ROSI|nr:unnamed protein product [Linum tenue]
MMSSLRATYPFRHTPLQIIHVIGNFLRIWSVYSMYRYLIQTGSSVGLFIFCCLLPSSLLFLAMQKPWKGRPLSNQQVVPSIINGVITALYFSMWGKGLKSCGPVRTILAEYAGAVLGVLSAALYGQGKHLWKKVGGLVAMMLSFYLLSRGWAMGTHSPFDILFCSKLNLKLRSKENLDAEAHPEEILGMKDMIVPIIAGILSALRRVIARRVSLKNQLKRRLHAITITSATCFLFPVAMWDFITGSTSDSTSQLPFSAWAFGSFILFGVILVFYVDSIAEERLHMVFSSPRHLMVAGGCMIILEIFYQMDFSLPGFLLCCIILGFGIYEATALERGKKGTQHFDSPEEMLDDMKSPLPT